MKQILITGAAPCTMADIEAVPNYRDYDFMAVGLDAVTKYRWPILYMATYHAEDIFKAFEARKQYGGNIDYVVISHEQPPLDVLRGRTVDIIVPHIKPSGSSTLMAAKAALTAGYSKIILCGCPLIGINPSTKGNYDQFRKGWQESPVEVRRVTRSMSGWTKEFLGAPTPEWWGGKDE